jgi:oxygen-independent coproporphyrinogen-3 oxidase
MRNVDARPGAPALLATVPSARDVRNTDDALDEAVRRATSGAAPWQLFDRRVQTHHEAAGAGHGRVLRDEAPKRLHEALACPEPVRRRAIYVHVPFCQKICSFCAFHRFSEPGDHVLDVYAAALRREIERLARSPWADAGPIDAIYIGGGTPTTLGPALLTGLIRGLRTCFAVAPECEVTVESRCSGVDASCLSALRAAGANRISFGVQSFDTVVRRGVGRIAGEKQVLEVLDQARRSGFAQVSVDLIYNLPRETDATWQRDLALLRDSPATGASIYALIPFERSVLQQCIARGMHPPLGGLERQFARFAAAAAALHGVGPWQRLSCEHYGDACVEHGVYNSLRGAGGDVLGIGAGAGGRIGRVSFMNSPSVETFVGGGGAGAWQGLKASREPADAAQRRRAFALSDAGRIALTDLAAALPACSAFLEKLAQAGLARCTADEVQLTDAGCFWSYNIGALLAELIHHSRKDAARCLEHPA